MLPKNARQQARKVREHVQPNTVGPTCCKHACD